MECDSPHGLNEQNGRQQLHQRIAIGETRTGKKKTKRKGKEGERKKVRKKYAGHGTGRVK